MRFKIREIKNDGTVYRIVQVRSIDQKPSAVTDNNINQLNLFESSKLDHMPN